jgi:AcrR family transcriptional regulator
MTAPAGQGPARPAPGLTRDRVLDAALAILESEGEERLTVRRLAAELGVAVTAVYWHVGDKDALLDGLVDRVVARVGPVRARGNGPEARLKSLCRSLRRTLLEQAPLVAFVQRRGRTAELFQPARRQLVAELTRAGLEPGPLGLAVPTLITLVVGSVLIDRQLARQPAQVHSAEELWSDVEVADPALLAALRHPPDEERVFGYTLDVVVEALLAGRRAAENRA